MRQKINFLEMKVAETFDFENGICGPPVGCKVPHPLLTNFPSGVSTYNCNFKTY